MALTLPEALKRARNLVLRGMIKSIVTTDEMAAVIPIVPTGGTDASFFREGTLPGTEFIGDDGVATESSTGTDDRVSVPMRRIVGNLDVDAFADDLTGESSGSQRGRQVAKKAKATWRKIKEKLITGGHTTGHVFSVVAAPFAALTSVLYGPWIDSARYGVGRVKYVHATTSWYFQAPGDVTYGPAVVAAADGTFVLRSWNKSKYIVVVIDVSVAIADGETIVSFTSTSDEFDGLNEVIDPSMVIDPVAANGDAYTLGLLDKMISTQKVRVNRAFIMNSQLIEKHYAAIRSASGGMTPQMLELPGYAGTVPSYRGIPILENDNILSNETVGSTTDASSIYLASLDADEGLYLAAAGGSAFNVDADPRSNIVLGFRVVDLGERDEADQRRIRVKWYGAPILKSHLAAVRRQGVTTA